MKQEIDIYKHDERLRSLLATLKESSVSQKNNDLIFKFYEFALINGLSKGRIIKYIEVMLEFGKVTEKDFDLVVKGDVEQFARYLEERDLSAWTKYTQKVVIKRFYKWLKGNNEFYPEEVKWMKCRIKRSEMKLPEEGDLIQDKEIETLINLADHPRNKALVSCLYESGCRIGEIATLQIKNVQIDEYGTVIVVQGKTGSRKIRLVFSTPHLATWIDNHPMRNDKNAPLWINIGMKHHNRRLEYDAIRMYLKKLFKKAGITKKSNPHSFRHARATCLANHLTEFQMNQYFGWIQGSTMPSVYVHLSGKEVDGAILELNGLKKSKEEKESILRPKKCVRCDTINSHQSKFCLKCGGILDLKTAVELQEAQKEEQVVRSEADQVMNALLRDPEIKEFLLKKIQSNKITT